MMNLAHAQLVAQEKNDVTALDLRTAEMSIELTAFKIALEFLEAGTDSFLDNEDVWLIDHDFMLKCYQLAAKTCYSVMDYGKMMSYGDALVKHAKTELDTIPSYVLQIR